MKKILLPIAALTVILASFTACKKTYVTNDITTIDTTAPAVLINDKTYPVTINFDKNQVINMPFTLPDSLNNISLTFGDSLVGTYVDIITYIQFPATTHISLSYSNHCEVPLITVPPIAVGTPGYPTIFSAVNVYGGYYDIKFVFNGNINGTNWVEWSITALP